MAVDRIAALRLLHTAEVALPLDALRHRTVGARAAQCRPTVAVERRPMAAEGAAADPPAGAAVAGLRQVSAGAADMPRRRATAQAAVGAAHITATVTDLNY